jgi:E3 ubiquitin ligase SMURF1/2
MKFDSLFFYLSFMTFIGLPDPFAKVVVDGGQVFTTDACKATVDPKWSSHYDLFLSRGDGITISVWNQKKVLKNSASGFMGCVRITSSTVQRLKDTGYQRLDLCKNSPDDPTQVRGQIIISLLSRDAITPGSGNPLAIVGPAGEIHGPEDDDEVATVENRQTNKNLPEGWEERKTNGRSYFVNHVSKTTQWSRPTLPASATNTSNSNLSSVTATSTTNTSATTTTISSPATTNGHSETTRSTAGPSRSATMNNIEQSPSNGSLNAVEHPSTPNRRHSTENLIGTPTATNGEISNSSSTNSIENKTSTVSSPTSNTSPRTVQNLTVNMSTLTIDTSPSSNNNNSNDTNSTAAVASNRILNKTTTNLSPTQQQQVPPNTTAPMNERSRSPPTILHQRSSSQDDSAVATSTNNNNNNNSTSTPQRSAEVIQNRNATDGKYLIYTKPLRFLRHLLNHCFYCTAQRVRRTSRSQEDSQRRQRQRQMRQVPVIIGSVRPNSTRPAIDLPPGYGKKYYFNEKKEEYTSKIILNL